MVCCYGRGVKMTNYILLIALIIVIVLGRALYYQLKMSYLKRVEKLYYDYIKSYDANTKIINPDLRKKLLEEKGELKKLFDHAGIPDIGESFMHPAGYGYLQQKNVKYFENIHIPNEDVLSFFHDSFLESIGFFKKRRNESFSVFYWVLLIINLPKHLFQFYGKEPKGIVYTFVDIVYKIAFIFGLIYAIVTGKKI
jgi:hypothetical protein